MKRDNTGKQLRTVCELFAGAGGAFLGGRWARVAAEHEVRVTQQATGDAVEAVGLGVVPAGDVIEMKRGEG